MLQTPRLFLRSWTDADKEPFAALNADPVVMAHFPAPLSRCESDAFAERIIGLMTQQGWGFWAVERREDGVFMGFTGLHCPNNLPCCPCMEVGWRLAKPFWGHGYATEAARVALDFAFDKLNVASVVSFTALTNIRSQAVMQRLGMIWKGEFDHPALSVGHRLRRHALYRLLAGQRRWK